MRLGMSEMCTDLQVVRGEGAEDLWWYIQAWGARQREAVVQKPAAHSLLHHPATVTISTIPAKTKWLLYIKVLLFSPLPGFDFTIGHGGAIEGQGPLL